MTPESSGHRLESLTGLRWFAALGVFGFHYRFLFTDRPGLSAALEFGYEGVPFFFVLSGFVLTWAHRPGDGVLRFYWHRFARIWPLMAVVALAMAAAAYHWTGATPPLADALFSVSLAQAWTTDHFYAVNMVAWTLSCEAFFYLLFPLLVRVLRRLCPAALAVVLLAADALTAGTRLWVAGHTYPPGTARLVVASPLALAPMFVVGVSAALLLGRGHRPPVGARASLLLCLAAFGLCWEWSQHPYWSGELIPGIGVYDALLVPFFALLLAALGLRDFTGGRSWFARPGVVLLGRVSFAFYLVHVLVLEVFRRHGRLTGPFTAADAVPLGAAFAVTLLVAWLLHVGVERPVERLLRHPADVLGVVRFDSVRRLGSLFAPDWR